MREWLSDALALALIFLGLVGFSALFWLLRP